MSMHIDRYPEALLDPNDPVSQDKYKAHYVHLREANVVMVRRSVRDSHASVNAKKVMVKGLIMNVWMDRWRLTGGTRQGNAMPQWSS